MKLREIRELSATDLGKKADELKRELGVEKGSAQGAKSSGKIRNLRRTIAKMLCIKKEMELGIHQPKVQEKAVKAGASAESASKSSKKIIKEEMKLK